MAEFVDPVAAIDELARTDPSARSVVTKSGVLDRGGLVRASRALACRLAPDDPAPVAYLGDFDASYLAVMLACRRLRRPFVPLDPTTSELRLAQMLLSSGATDVVLTVGGPRPPLPSRPIRITTFDISAAVAEGDPPAVRHPDEIAFVVYTSGSTGVPKGVAQPPRTLASIAALERKTVDLRPGDRVVLVSPPGLVSAPVLSFAALAAGAELLAVGNGSDVGALLAFMSLERATHFLGYVGLARALASHPAAKSAFSAMRAIQVFGDVVGVEDCAVLRSPMPPGGAVHLLYGLTECIMMVLWAPPEAFPGEGGRLPLGPPADGAELWLDVMDGGDEGELLGVSPRTMSGYWRNEAANRACFVAHPDDPGRKLFATGDVVRLRPDGMLEFVGRRDNQVKLRGWRIELEEIEATARRMPGVTGAGVAPRRSGRVTVDALALHFTGDALPDDVRAGLAAVLPDYMVPTHVVPAPALPLTPTGQIDRVRLAEIDRQRRDQAETEGGDAAQLWPDPLARRIAAIIAEEAGVEVVPPDVAALEAGMDSLQAVNAALRIEKQFAVSIEPGQLLGEHTFAAIVGDIMERARISG
ncbi:MAG: non-ribosomal peptide synthetase [Alphaproteobacteria bacterium]